MADYAHTNRAKDGNAGGNISGSRAFRAARGRLAYMTCSVLEAENKTQVDKFLRESSISLI